MVARHVPKEEWNMSVRISGSDGIAPGIGLIVFVGVEQLPVICTDS